MIEALIPFNAEVAAAILARTAFSLERKTGEDENFVLSNEPLIRREVLRSIKIDLGISEDDNSDEAIQLIIDAIDAEIESITAIDDSGEVLDGMGEAGKVPSDLYEISITKALVDVYRSDWEQESELVNLTIKNPDREQHFSNESNPEEPTGVSLFCRFYKSKFPYRSFNHLIIGQRRGLNMMVDQSWHIYDGLEKSNSSDFIDMLRGFCNNFGINFEIEGKIYRFLYIKNFPAGLSGETKLKLLPDKKKKSYHVIVTKVETPDKSGAIKTAFTMAIDIDKYRESLKTHRANEEIRGILSSNKKFL